MLNSYVSVAVIDDKTGKIKYVKMTLEQVFGNSNGVSVQEFEKVCALANSLKL